jgi:predicted heme/steroid binding protein
MKVFTKEEVAQYDGKNGNPAYVVYKGKVYDVSSSFLWKDGKHQIFHSAGLDLTKALEQAPHGGDVIEKFPVVGILLSADRSQTSSKP